MPTADSLERMLKSKSTLIAPKAPLVIPKAIAKPVVDPSAARYAAMEAQEKARLAAIKAAPDDQIGRRIAISQPITTNTAPSTIPAPSKGIPKDDVVGRRMVLGEPITTSTAVDKYGVNALPGDQLERRIALGEPITTDTATDKYGTTKPVVKDTTPTPTTTTTTPTTQNPKDEDPPVAPVVIPPVQEPVKKDDDEEPPVVVVIPGSGSGNAATAPAIKVATPDIITIDQETLPSELMTAMIFESIGGQELINISRHDLITGGNLEYQPIKNMAIINAEYGSGNIIFMPDSSSEYLRNFTIDWESHTIESFSDLDSSHIGIDTTKNEVYLLVTNMKPGEQIETQVLRSVTPYDYTKF